MKTLSIFLVLLCVIPAVAQDTTGMKKANIQGADISLMSNHDPASQLENFDLLPGYQVNLFAANPMLANPVHMNWDSRGRLWVACSWAYPQLMPGEVANDKIIILEDTDGDGAADKSTVFADGLYVPTGLELANGGCYVGQSPDIFFLKDTDGDDVADIKESVLTGFGIEDSHHSISAWRRGPGGWIYFQEGIFLNTQVETAYGVVRNYNGGVYQFNPRTNELRLFCRGTGGNPWGHVFDRWGQSFMVNNPRIMYLSPATGNSGENVPVKTLISTSKQCGGDIATGSHIGDDLRGQLLTGRFKNRLVVRYEFIDQGDGFAYNVLSPLITSKHPNFRPVDVKTGPDGAVYVADWYNSIINHAQHDFRDPRRDNEHGRIWRITHKTRPLVEKPALVGRPIPELVAQLGSPETWTRSYARKELSERDPDAVLAAVEAWASARKPNNAETAQDLVEAMWAVQNVERVSEAILTRVLEVDSGQARSAGARVLRYWHHGLSDPVGLVAKTAADPFPRTRMEAILSAGFMARAEAYPAALNALDHPRDAFIDQALVQTAKALDTYWRPAMEAGTLAFADDTHRAYVEERAGLGFGKRLAALLRNPTPEAKELKQVTAQLVAHGTPKEIESAIKTLGRNKDLPEATSLAILQSLLRLSEKQPPPKSVGRHIVWVRNLLDHRNPDIASRAAETLGAWNTTRTERDLLRILNADTTPANVQHATAVALGRFARDTDIKTLTDLTGKQHPMPLRYAAVAGLARADLDAGLAAMTVLADNPGDADPVPLIRSVINQHRKAARSLATALDTSDIHPAVTERVAAFHRSSGFLPHALASIFVPKQPGRSLSQQLLAENQTHLTEDVVKHGNPYRGERIYRRKSIACTSCHATSSAGPTLGPNLAAVGAGAGPEYMVESILRPNAAIAEYFENRLFTLKSGAVQMGVVTFRSETEVTLRDAAQAGKEITLATADIQREQEMPSFMPAGLADQLADRQEFLDLAKFMSVLGTAGDFAENEAPLIRKWRLRAAQPSEKKPPAETAAWLPAYSTVSGELPTADLGDVGDLVWARGFIEVQIEGPISIKVNQAKGLRLWINAAQTDLGAVRSLPVGRHLLTFLVDRKTYGIDTPLRVELEVPSPSPAKFQVEGGP